MAPKGGRGGGGGGGVGGSGGKGNSYRDTTSIRSKSSKITSFFGDRDASLYTHQDLSGLIAASVLIAVVLIIIIGLAFWDDHKRKVHRTQRRIKGLKFAVFLMALGYVLLMSRYASLMNEGIVLRSYRLEPVFTRLFERLGELWVLAAAVMVATQPISASSNYDNEKSKWTSWMAKRRKVFPYILIFVLFTPFLIYSGFEFAFAHEALKNTDFNRWLLTDRDFGLLLTRAMAAAVKMSGHGFLDTKPYKSSELSGRLRGPENLGEAAVRSFQDRREIMIKIGIAADVIVLAIIVLAGVRVVMRQIRSKVTGERRILLATVGALLALYMVAIMRLVMSSHFILPNFQIIAHPLRWDKWDLYDMKMGTLWFRGYRFPVNGWPVIELVIEGLGRIIAAACMLDVAGKAMKGKLVG